jgi:protein TonB
VKRFIFAAIIAISLHILIFQADPAWFQGRPFKKPGHEIITLSLTYHKAEKPAPTQVVKVSEPPRKKTVPKQRKKVKMPEPPRKKPVPKPEKKKKIKKNITKKPEKQKKKEVVKKDHIEKKELEKKEEISEDPEPVFSEPVFSNKPYDNETAEYFQVPDTTEEIEDVDESEQIAEKGLPASIRKHARAVKEAMPLYKINPRPEYPRIARRRGYEGTVVLGVLVTRHGKVRKIEIDKSSGYSILDRAALSAVKDWEFEPARRGKENIEMWVKVPIKFRLR